MSSTIRRFPLLPLILDASLFSCKKESLTLTHRSGQRVIEDGYLYLIRISSFLLPLTLFTSISNVNLSIPLILHLNETPLFSSSLFLPRQSESEEREKYWGKLRDGETKKRRENRMSERERVQDIESEKVERKRRGYEKCSVIASFSILLIFVLIFGIPFCQFFTMRGADEGDNFYTVNEFNYWDPFRLYSYFLSLQRKLFQDGISISTGSSHPSGCSSSWWRYHSFWLAWCKFFLAGNWMPRPISGNDVPPGLEYLALVDHIFVKQAGIAFNKKINPMTLLLRNNNIVLNRRRSWWKSPSDGNQIINT